jgi:CDP-paratose synthetase
MTSPVLITGASGFLGSHLTAALIGRGTPVLAATRGSGLLARLAPLAPLAGPLLRIVRWNPTDPVQLLADMPGMIVHAAACYGRQGESPADLVAANVQAGLRLLEQAAAGGVQGFIHIGSSLPPTVSPYARSKRQFAEWAETFSTDLPIAEIRCEHFYGAGDDPTKFTTRVARACLAGQPSLALTAGTQRRDFVHIDDAVAGILAVIDRGMPRRGHVCYPLGSGAAVPVRQVVELIHRRAASATRLDFGAIALRPGEPDCCQADISALGALGWAPRLRLDAGLNRFVDEERTLCAS